MTEKVQMLAWFLRRPRLYPQLVHLATKKLSRATYERNRTTADAMRWCAERCMGSPAAIERLTGAAAPLSLEQRFPSVFAEAAHRAAACPVSMGGPGDMNLLYAIAEQLQARRVIETGVAYGWSSLAILLSLNHRAGARLISTDMPIPAAGTEAYVGCAVPDALRGAWTVISCADRQALPRALREMPEIDMCHYDSDKSYEGRAWTYPLLWNALRQGGILVSDDIGDNFAFRDFARQLGRDPLVIRMQEPSGTKYAGILVKE